MPVAFNAPPFPSADATVAAATDSSAPTGAIADDAFALVLAKAGGDLIASDGKGVAAALTRNARLDARAGRILADDKSPRANAKPPDLFSTTDASSGEVAAKPAPSSKAEPAIDPAAMAAALGVAIAARPNADLIPSRSSPLGVPTTVDRHENPLSGTGLVQEAPVATEALAVASTTGLSDAPVDHPAPQVNQGMDRFEPPPVVSNLSTPMSTMRANAALGATATTAEPAAAMVARLNANTGASGASDPAQAPGIYHIAPAPPPPVHAIDTPVTAPAWQGEFADRLTQVVMLRNDRAEFHLHPAELGPVDVQISFAADQAVILITAAHATTRDALEQALPYLRDMLADHGIALGHASVQDERHPADPGSARDDATGRPLGAVAGTREVAVRTVRLKGLVDVFA